MYASAPIFLAKNVFIYDQSLRFVVLYNWWVHLKR